MPEHYVLQVEKLNELEQMSREEKIDLFYGDETHVCSEGYVPYGWQFPDEDVCILSEKSYQLNCFGFISRQNQCRWKTTEENIDSQFIVEYLEEFSFAITKKTFLVLENARVHKSKMVQERISYWQKRGMFIFFLPP